MDREQAEATRAALKEYDDAQAVATSLCRVMNSIHHSGLRNTRLTIECGEEATAFTLIRTRASQGHPAGSHIVSELIPVGPLAPLEMQDELKDAIVMWLVNKMDEANKRVKAAGLPTADAAKE